jgi:hypothetical protein
MKNWTQQGFVISSGSCQLKCGYAEEFYMPPIPYLSETHTSSHAVKLTREVLHSIEKLIALHYEDEERNYLDWVFNCDDESDEILSKMNLNIDKTNYVVGGDKHIKELAEIGIVQGYNHMFLDFYGMKKWYDENLTARDDGLDL